MTRSPVESSPRRWHTRAVDPAIDDEPIDELLELTRQLRGQLSRHAALGTWAAPGGASARIEPADGEAGTESLVTAPEASPAAAVDAAVVDAAVDAAVV